MNKKVVAGIGLIAGALGLYLWTTKKAKPCTEGATKCDAGNLYTCVNGKWVLTEANSPICVVPPSCSIDSDCPPGYVCENGVCVVSPLPPLPEGFNIGKIDAVPPITTLGNAVEIRVWWDCLDAEHVAATFTPPCTVDGVTVSAFSQVWAPTAVGNVYTIFKYAPGEVGIYTATVANKQVSFEILPQGADIPGIFYNPYGCYRTSVYYCRHVPSHADYCESPSSVASPPYWDSRNKLITSMEHLSRGWGGNFGGLAIDEDCGGCVSGEANRYTYGFADYRCPYCGQEFTYGPAGGGETYYLVLDQLLTHIEQSHLEFPLNKPPCWLAIEHVSLIETLTVYINGQQVTAGSSAVIPPVSYHIVADYLPLYYWFFISRGLPWTGPMPFHYDGIVTLSNWGDRIIISSSGVQLQTWESLTGERVPA